MAEFFGEQSFDDAWGAGYRAGQEGMAKAVATAEFLTEQRIIKLLDDYEIWPTHEHEAMMMGSKFDAFIQGFSTAIALIKEKK